MDYTESFQLLPEQSTAAIIIHHPEAKYYAVRGERLGSQTVDKNVAIDRAEIGEISLAEARADT
jgi:5-methyltetrahydrofolate--homocysteine methyltransferase